MIRCCRMQEKRDSILGLDLSIHLLASHLNSFVVSHQIQNLDSLLLFFEDCLSRDNLEQVDLNNSADASPIIELERIKA